MKKLTLEVLPYQLGIVRCNELPSLEVLGSNRSSFFTLSQTDREISLVAEIDLIQELNLKSEVWRGVRFEGVLDFALKGILAQISMILAKADISIFAISTFETDYILMNISDFDRAIEILKDHYNIIE